MDWVAGGGDLRGVDVLGAGVCEEGGAQGGGGHVFGKLPDLALQRDGERLEDRRALAVGLDLDLLRVEHRPVEAEFEDVVARLERQLEALKR